MVTPISDWQLTGPRLTCMFNIAFAHHFMIRSNRRFYVLSPRLETLTCGLHPVKLTIYKDEVSIGFCCVISLECFIVESHLYETLPHSSLLTICP